MHRKGITPVVSIIILLFITVALLGSAWSYLQGFLMGRISKSFDIPTNGIYCENGVIKVFIQNTGQGKLTENDFIVHDVDGVEVPLKNLPLDTGKAALIMEYDCGGACSDYHTINLGTQANLVHPKVYCP
jgi:flagellin-like protein